MCSKLPSSLKTLIACCAAFDIGFNIRSIVYISNPIFAGVKLYFHLQGDVIYCDISAGSGRTPGAAFKL
jgi:hypothetical protein